LFGHPPKKKSDKDEHPSPSDSNDEDDQEEMFEVYDSASESQAAKQLGETLLEQMDQFIDDCTEKTVFDERSEGVTAQMVKTIKEFEAKNGEKVSDEFFSKFETQTKQILHTIALEEQET